MNNVITLQPVRRHARVECEAPVRVEREGRVIEACCKNLSLGGMWIDFPGFAVGEAVEVTLSLPELGAVHARASVRRVDHEGMGLQFHWLEPIDLVRLHRFVAHRLGVLENLDLWGDSRTRPVGAVFRLRLPRVA